jgi:glycosyltransferase involved in cell wall biosynthesis
VYRGLRIAVVIPAFNERGKIVETVATIPAFVDHVLVIDDASRDDTAQQARAAAARRDAAARSPRAIAARWRSAPISRW